MTIAFREVYDTGKIKLSQDTGKHTAMKQNTKNVVF
jgi:hypothetical protein